MVAPRLRSNSAKTRQRRSPTGKPILLVRPKKVSKATCALCGAKLNAVPSSRERFIKDSKTEKRPERLFGGVLCGNCVQSLLKERARLQSGVISKTDVSITHLKYINMLKN